MKSDFLLLFEPSFQAEITTFSWKFGNQICVKLLRWNRRRGRVEWERTSEEHHQGRQNKIGKFFTSDFIFKFLHNTHALELSHFLWILCERSWTISTRERLYDVHHSSGEVVIWRLAEHKSRDDGVDKICVRKNIYSWIHKIKKSFSVVRFFPPTKYIYVRCLSCQKVFQQQHTLEFIHMQHTIIMCWNFHKITSFLFNLPWCPSNGQQTRGMSRFCWRMLLKDPKSRCSVISTFFV